MLFLCFLLDGVLIVLKLLLHQQLWVLVYSSFVEVEAVDSINRHSTMFAKVKHGFLFEVGLLCLLRFEHLRPYHSVRDQEKKLMFEKLVLTGRLLPYFFGELIHVLPQSIVALKETSHALYPTHDVNVWQHKIEKKQDLVQYLGV